MEGAIEPNSVLDIALFRIMANHNRFHATGESQGKFEKLASGHLDILASHLPQAKYALSKHATNLSFKLKISGKTESCTWFTKRTLLSFLSLVSSSELLRSLKSVQNEIFQLEDTRKRHLSQYRKDPQSHSSNATEESEFTTKVEIETKSADATKIYLLWAIDQRLKALTETLGSTLNQAVGCSASVKLISDVEAFCRYFGASEIRNSLLKYLELVTGKDIGNYSFIPPQKSISNIRNKIVIENTPRSTSPMCELPKVNPSEYYHPIKRSDPSTCQTQIQRSISPRSPTISIKDQNMQSFNSILKDHIFASETPNPRRWSSGMFDVTTPMHETERETDTSQILLKVTESQPSLVNKETHGEKRGDFYDLYKERRDQRLQSETARRNRAERESQLKIMQQVLDQRREEMRSSNSNCRRNSCPPALPKKLTGSVVVPIESTPILEKQSGQKSTGEEREIDQTEKWVEWGNDERPPALVYQRKDRKGWKRLFIFGQRKKVNACSLLRSTPGNVLGR